MDKGNLEFLSKTVEQSITSKHAILTNDAPTIVETFKNPKIKSEKKKRKIKIISSGGKVIVKTISSVGVKRIGSERVAADKSSEEKIEDINPSKYKKGEVNRFSEYSGVTSPKDKNISLKKDMSNPSNNGFIAAIVEQSGGGKSAIMNNDASTLVEKYQTPMIKAGEDESEDNYEDDVDMSDFSPADSMELPTIWLNTKQLPSAEGLVVGDKVYLMVEAEISNHSKNENSDGLVREEYTFKLKKGCIKKDD